MPRKRKHDFVAAAESPATDNLRLTATADIEIVAAADGKPAPRPRVRLVAYTGVPMNVSGFYTPVVIELSGLRAPKAQIPLLLDHDTAQIIGQTEEIKVADGQAVVSGIITGDDAPAAKVVAHARNGFKWQASVGAQVLRREFVDAGKTVTVNGRTVSGPLEIAREAVLREVSLVAIGADADTSAAIAATHANGKDSAMTFEQWLQAKGFDPAKISDQQKATLQAAWQAEVKAAAQPPATGQAPAAGSGQPTPPAGSRDLDAVLAEARRDRERQAAITAAVEDALKANPAAVDRIEAIGRAAVRDVWTVEKARLELMLESRPTAPNTIIRGASPVTGDMVEAALLMSCGAPEDSVIKSHSQPVVEQAAKRWRQGLGLMEVLQLAAKQRGYDYQGRDVQQLLQAAFSPLDVRAAAPSTLDIGGILSNVANKFLKLGFDAVEQAWREIAAIRSVRDFKAVTSYSLTGDLTYAEIAPGGEIKHGTLGERERKDFDPDAGARERPCRSPASGPGAGADGRVSSDFSTSTSTAADGGPDPARARQATWLRVQAAVIPLLGRVPGGGRVGVSDSQHTANETVLRQWWEEDLWPAHAQPDEAGPVVARFLGLVEQARRAENPMAWLTQAIKSGGLDSADWETPALAQRRRKPLAELTRRKAGGGVNSAASTSSAMALAAPG